MKVKDPEDYKGYFIQKAFATGMYYISKNSYPLASARTLEEAKQIIDEFLT